MTSEEYRRLHEKPSKSKPIKTNSVRTKNIQKVEEEELVNNIDLQREYFGMLSFFRSDEWIEVEETGHNTAIAYNIRKKRWYTVRLDLYNP